MMLRKFLLIALTGLGACANPSKNQSATFTPDSKAGAKAYTEHCASCHGQLGEGVLQLQSPALGGLDAAYVYRQMMNFKNEYRGHAPQDTLGQQMATIAKNILDTLMLRNISAYVEQLSLPQYPHQANADAKNGKEIYQSICGSCHGSSGKGNPKFNAPALVGLQPWYITGQFKKFKNGWRGSHPADKWGAQMAAITSLVNDEQSIYDVVAYLQTENTKPGK
ncbi:MAG: c-type cytochrome [Bacteroidetes bacterium]|nr:c-type cytochrome [Bacteroidota bacterium]MBS1539654.1 c-type cytochrome [Bacteroidota bacterium]